MNVARIVKADSMHQPTVDQFSLPSDLLPGFSHISLVNPFTVKIAIII